MSWNNLYMMSIKGEEVEAPVTSEDKAVKRVENRDAMVELTMLRCLECDREVPVAANGIYFTIAGLNYFCGGDCEDKYAFKQ